MLISITLIVIIAAVFMQAGNHQFLDYDDEVYVTGNSRVASGITGENMIWAFTSVYAGNWHPLTWLSHMADVRFFGMNPRGHHLTNVVIHAISAVLLLLLLLRITGARWHSTFVAALFALHPLHVESVAWVAERKDVLSAFFWFLTMLLYSEYVKKPKKGLYILTLFSFALGLMSKSMLVTLPVVLLMMDYWPLGRYRNEEEGQSLRQRSGRVIALVKEKIPFFALSLCSGVVTIYAQHSGGAMSDLDVVPFGLRIENALIAYATYIIKTLWPHDLAVFYPFSFYIPLWQVICSLIVFLVFSAAAIRGGRRYPYLAVGWFWYLVTLVPVIGLVQVGVQSMADRYTYIPLTGLFIIVAWGVPDVMKGLQHRECILALLAGTVISASAVVTWQQLGHWRDSITLYRHTLQATTGNYWIHYNLGGALANKGDLDEAIHEYRETLRINPNYAKAHNNLGFAFAAKGNLDSAIQEF
ncbi:MAG: tetratricopeptide repeat protein, partial [Chlorobiales bacterium]|nr:tetratricopeptide repeat protein [Chlorobiales bacterium]